MANVFSSHHGDIHVNICKNTGGQRTFYHVSLTKHFKDGDKWVSTSAMFSKDHTLTAAKLLNWAHDVTQQDSVDSDKPFTSQSRTLEPDADILEAAVSQDMDDQQQRYRVRLKLTCHRQPEKEEVVELTPYECLLATNLLGCCCLWFIACPKSEVAA